MFQLVSPRDVSDRRLSETGVSRKVLALGRMLNVVEDTVRLPDSTTATREFVLHPGAVMIVPLLGDGRVVLERQFRYPVGRVMTEFPAGKLDAGESSLACAQRELREETGYSAQEWAFAGTTHPVIAYSTEHIDVWFARKLTPGDRHLDPGEFLDVIATHPEELFSWCLQGAVTDAKTLVGVLWLQNVLRGDMALDWGGPDPALHVQPAGPKVPTVTEVVDS